MANENNTLLDSVDRLPERIATMLAPVLAETFEMSTSKVMNKVVKKESASKTSKSISKESSKAIRDLDELNKSLRVLKQGIKLNAINKELLTAKDNINRKKVDGLNKLLAYDPKDFEKLDSINRQLRVAKLGNLNKQLSMSRLSQSQNKVESFILKQTFPNLPMNMKQPSTKPLKTSSSMWHNLDLLSKGAIPLAWKDQKGVELLGQILSISKGSLKLEKEENKIWNKLWKDSLKSGTKSAILSAGGALRPFVGGLATIAGFSALQSMVKMSGNNPLVRQGAQYAMVLAPVIGAALSSFLPEIIGGVLSGSIARSGMKSAFKGIGKFGLTAGSMAVGAYEGYSAYNNFSKGNTMMGIGDSISSLAGMVGMFLPGWGKLVALIPLLWEAAKKFLGIKEDNSPMDRWLKDLGIGSYSSTKSNKGSILGKTLDNLIPFKKDNLKNTMGVIKDFQNKVGGQAYISSITGGKHSPLSGHYQGKKFDVGLYGKSDAERIKQYKALSATKGVSTIGFETPDQSKYKSFKMNLEKKNIDTSKLKPYYWTKNSSGEHFDVSTKKVVQTGISTQSIRKQQDATEEAFSGSPVKKTNYSTINRINSQDPGKRKLSATSVLNSLVNG